MPRRRSIADSPPWAASTDTPHIDGRIRSNPAEYVRRPKVHPTEHRGLDRTEFDMFLSATEHYDPAHQALAVLLGLNGLRVGEAYDTNIEDLAFERGHLEAGPVAIERAVNGVAARAAALRTDLVAE